MKATELLKKLYNLTNAVSKDKTRFDLQYILIDAENCNLVASDGRILAGYRFDAHDLWGSDEINLTSSAVLDTKAVKRAYRAFKNDPTLTIEIREDFITISSIEEKQSLKNFKQRVVFPDYMSLLEAPEVFNNNKVMIDSGLLVKISKALDNERLMFCLGGPSDAIKIKSADGMGFGLIMPVYDEETLSGLDNGAYYGNS